LIYDDASSAMEFLIEAFGAERVAVYAGDDGTIRHAELRFDNGILMLGSAMPDAPATAGRASVYVAVGDPDDHWERARAAGAELVHELHGTDYGSRDYAAKDPEGNTWYFGTYQPFAYDHEREPAKTSTPG
jgi:uncharacterized glyoxalase superfamily protein PhnB